MVPNNATDAISPPLIPNTVIQYGTFVKYDTQIDTINPFKIMGGKAAANLFGILLVRYAAIRVTKLPPSISIKPKEE